MTRSTTPTETSLDDYAGRCGGYRCDCRTFELARPDRSFPVCRCGHARQTHAKTETAP